MGPGSLCSPASFNECEDSLLATPLILDLTILAEVMTRIQVRRTPFSLSRSLADPSLFPRSQYRPSPSAESFAAADETVPFEKLYSVLSLLSYSLKAPLVKEGTGVVNSLSRQRQALEQFFKATLGMDNQGDLLLTTRLQ